MKKLLILLFTFYSFVINAQSYTTARDIVALEINKFLTVKGIELKPNMLMKDMLTALESKGFEKTVLFEYIKELYGGYELNGPFYSYSCRTKVLPISSNKEIVGLVNISFPNGSSFKQLKALYDNLKSSLSGKYFLHESIEKFDDDLINEKGSDFLKMNALSKDEGTFKSIFYVSEEEKSLLLGQVVLTISHIYVNYEHEYFVSLSYCTSDEILEQLKSSNEDL